MHLLYRDVRMLAGAGMRRSGATCIHAGERPHTEVRAGCQQIHGSRARTAGAWLVKPSSEVFSLQLPAMVRLSMRIEPVRTLPRSSTSLPTAAIPRYMSRKFAAMVISSTG